MDSAITPDQLLDPAPWGDSGFPGADDHAYEARLEARAAGERD